MANATIKITQLPNLGSNIATNTVLPVVDISGTAITGKVNVGNLANFALTEAGNLLPPAFVSELSYNVVNAAQPNITSVGTLTSLAVNSITNVNIPGGENGYFLQTNGDGVLSWSAQSGAGNGSPGGANTQIQYNDEGSFGGSTFFTYNKDTETLATPNILTTAATVYGNLNAVNVNITTNLFAEISEANSFTANSITSVGNVSAEYFIGNGSTLTGITATASGAGPNTSLQFNNDGIFDGDANLTWDSANSTLNTVNVVAVSVEGNVTASSVQSNTVTANYLAGDGSNITNIGNANYANSTDIANTAGVANSVAVGNVVGIGNIAVVSLDGSSSNVLHGNGVFATVTSVANANFASFSNVANLSNTVVVESVNNNYSYHVVLTTGANDYTLHNDADDGFQYNPQEGLLTVTRVDADFAVANLYYSNGYPAANVVGLGNLSLINTDGNASNVLYGNGVFAAAPSGSSYGDSNVVTLLSSFGSNTITTTGNIAAGAVTASGKIGYANGGTVTQTGTGQGVTLNQLTGQITLAKNSWNVGDLEVFILTCNKVDNTDYIMAQAINSVESTFFNVVAYPYTPLANSIQIQVNAIQASTVAPVIQYFIMKAATS